MCTIKKKPKFTWTGDYVDERNLTGHYRLEFFEDTVLVGITPFTGSERTPLPTYMAEVDRVYKADKQGTHEPPLPDNIRKFVSLMMAIKELKR